MSGSEHVTNSPAERRAAASAGTARLPLTGGAASADTSPAAERVSGTTAAAVLPLALAAYAATLHRYTGQEAVSIELVRGGGRRAVSIATPEDGDFASLVSRAQEALDGGGRGVASAEWRFVVEEGSAASSPAPGAELVLTARVETEDTLELTVPGDDAGSDAAGRRRFLGHVASLARTGSVEPAARLARLPLATPAERDAMVRAGAASGSFDGSWCLHERFSRTASQFTDAEAVSGPERRVTYAELETGSNRLAHHLMESGVAPGDLVGVCVERSAQLPVAILGVLKAGAAYVPVDPSVPAERARFILDDCGATVLVGTSTALDRIGLVPGDGPRAILLDVDAAAIATCPDAVPAVASDPDAVAYVIYTSGSTGRPKGVRVSHRNVARLFTATDAWYGFGPDDVWTLFHSYAFDFSVWEIWGALLYGGRLVVVPFEATRDPGAFHALLRAERVTVLNQTPSAFRLLIAADGRPDTPRLESLRHVIFGGEALELESLRRWFERYGDRTPRLVNMYGITETTVHVTYRPIALADLDAGRGSVIGRAIPDLELYLIDPGLEPVPVGVPGEICVGGAGVALGYLDRPELTAERFVPNPFGDGMLYRSGDLARRLPDGDVEYLGRIDQQVKIRGYRIELGEIETALTRHERVTGAVVDVREDEEGNRSLVAWVTAAGVDAAALRAHAARLLPDYMVPSEVRFVDAFPLTGNGKADRRALAATLDEPAEPASVGAPALPVAEMEALVAEVWGRHLALDAVDPDEGFFQLGGTSLKSLEVAQELARRVGFAVPVVKVYEHPTVRALARWMSERSAARAKPAAAAVVERARPEGADRRIAIVGMAGRFPGARDVEELWANLRAGRGGRVEYGDDELRARGVAEELLRDPDYVKAGYPLEASLDFDAEFFGLTPRETELMDPQQRLFLELAWAALEHAGYDPRAVGSTVGVFGGVGRNSYLLNNLWTHGELRDMLVEHPGLIGNERDFPTTHVSYRLGLDGPSIDVQTACSTSGVAVHLARRALLDGDCDVALAGGCKVIVPDGVGYLYVDGGALSPDGRIHAFDAGANGMIRGSGGGMLVLKRYADALRDGDRVWGVVAGSAVNNDGAGRVGYTAPSPEGQSRVIAAALRDAGVPADAIDYVETHGTGTRLGDPIEIEGLTRAYRETTDAAGFCGVGSIKTNIGHLDAGATAAGLIKVLLALDHEELPPSINFSEPNPHIGFDGGPFYVVDRARPWRRGERPRRAGVSSFGLGGTNAHLIIEEPPVPEREPAPAAEQLLPLSARSAAALDAQAARLADALDADAAIPLADVAFTLQQGRHRFDERRFVVARDAVEAARRLRAAPSAETRATSAGVSGVAFLFPGGGAQYPAMAAGLYRDEPAFRDAFDACAAVMREPLGVDLADALFGEFAAAPLDFEAPALALPALFSVEYALAQLWRAWGVEPAAMIGHSMGEYVAAQIAGVVSLEDALRLVALRGRLFETLPAGSMLAVPAPEADVRSLLGDELAVAAINRPDSTVVSGPEPAIEALAARLEAMEIESTRVRIRVAAHSPMVEPMLDEFHAFASTIAFAPPRIPYVSNVTGTWIRDDEATDPAYWTRHIRRTVRFSDGLATLATRAGLALVEVGPGRTLTSFARMHPATAGLTAVSSIRHPTEEVDDRAYLLGSLGRLWTSGLEPDWPAVRMTKAARRVALPAYPFERKRYCLEPVTAPAAAATGGQNTMQDAAASPMAMPVAAPTHEQQTAPPTGPGIETMATQATEVPRRGRIVADLRTVLHELSGLDAAGLDPNASFLELGFDSLFLAQANAAIKRRFKVKTTVRQLLEATPSIDALAGHLDEKLPADFYPPQAAPAPAPAVAASAAPAQAAVPTAAIPAAAAPLAAPAPLAANAPAAPAGSVQWVIQQQLEIMRQQLAALGAGGAPAAVPAPVAAQPVPAVAAQPAAAASPAAAPQAAVAASSPAAAARPATAPAHGPWRPLDRERRDGMTPSQRGGLEDVIERLNRMTPRSKSFAAEHRNVFADPRSIQGFRSEWKEIVYPIVVDTAKAGRIVDVDGNEYVDVVGGFGVNFFGHSPDFVTEAVRAQLESGVAIGPQSALAGEAAQLVSDLTGMERVTFCNTGSEAVLAALRIARTVTGRSRIATFSSHYHGVFDEVLVKAVDADGVRRNFPIAPGIPKRAVEDTLVLDFGHPSALDAIRAHANELSAVILEPVRSRNPDHQPVEFIRELRALTEQLGIPLIFDEMITGFRSHPGGAQALWDIRADLATYGKVVGGGYPIGVVAGRADYMDALDGGSWRFGDDSVPEADMTWFAGTFVRHPVAMAAAVAALRHLKEEGPALQADLNARTTEFVREMNEHFERTDSPIWLEHFSSFFLLTHREYQEYSDLLTHFLLTHGVFSRETRPLFWSVAHTDEDWTRVADGYKQAVADMRASGLLTARGGAITPVAADLLPAAAADDDAFDVVPMTEPQREVWLGTRFGAEASSAFNLSIKLELEGDLDVDAARGAIQQLVARHDALRSSIDEDGEVQRIRRRLEIDVPVIDLSADAEPDAAADRLELDEVCTPFDLERGPLVRARIFRLGNGRWRLLLFVHHIVADGWSCGVMARDLGALYEARHTGRRAELRPVIRFADYVRMLDGAEEREERAAAEAWWIERYRTLPPPLDLPTDRPRPAVKTYEADRVSIRVAPERVKPVRDAAGRAGATLFAFTFAAFDAWVARLTGQTDFAVGFDLAGQALVPGGDLVGHCVSFLPVRADVDVDAPFSALLAAKQSTLFDVMENQRYTYGSLLQKVRVPIDPSRQPLVGVAFNLDPSSLGARFGDLAVRLGSVPRQYENNDLFVNLLQLEDGGLELQCTYNLDLFDAATVRRRMEEYLALLDTVAAEPDRVVGGLDVVTDEESRRLVDWNDTAVDFPAGVTLHGLVAQQAAATPDAIAVTAPEGTVRSLTYGELERRASSLASRLQQAGVGRDRTVAVCMDRSAELVVALLAVLKAGGAYVPIDPSYPAERRAFMLDDCGATVVLSSAALAGELPGGSTVIAVDRVWDELLDDAAPVELAAPDSLAYVIYTSGSTGRPKGAMIEHRSITNRLLWMQRQFAMTPQDAVLQKTSFAFDVSVWEFFWPLVTGARLVMARPDGQKDAGYLARTVRDEGISVLHFVPSMLPAFLDEPAAAEATSLRLVVCSGEALGPATRNRFFATLTGVELYNLYGPTEAAVDVSFWRCSPDGPPATVPIGHPVANTQLHVLDDARRPVPVGVPGELYIGGVQVARGYLDRPDLTAERFVPDPFAAGGRLYRTGDLVRRRDDGALEFLGRLDFQVKLRGFRIELGEIEATLERQPEVRRAVVDVRDAASGDPLLTAWVVPAAAGADFDALGRAVAASLPDYMVPQQWVELEAIPLSANGKADRKALPDPRPGESAGDGGGTPETDAERAVAEIWSEVLGVPAIGRDHHFFQLGGHSILATRVVSRLRRDLGVDVPLRTLFTAPTLRAFAEVVDDHMAAAAVASGADRAGADVEEVVL